ncbi:MAG: hypothetical protein JWQ38_2186, partial [Flavipsychrobacter sp.]|nr:hypothetical protein [Flavipsychrobacter sp.]
MTIYKRSKLSITIIPNYIPTLHNISSPSERLGEVYIVNACSTSIDIYKASNLANHVPVEAHAPRLIYCIGKFSM